MNQFSMNRRRFFTLIGAAVISLLLTIGLPLLNNSTVVAQSGGNLLVSAAASLKDAMSEIKTVYQQSKPGTNITYNFGASGALQQQIEQGAPADIFFSAAAKQMNALQDKNLILLLRINLLVHQDIIHHQVQINLQCGRQNHQKIQIVNQKLLGILLQLFHQLNVGENKAFRLLFYHFFCFSK